MGGPPNASFRSATPRRCCHKLNRSRCRALGWALACVNTFNPPTHPVKWVLS